MKSWIEEEHLVEETISFMHLQMEYCDSGDLSGFLRKQNGTKLTIDRVLDWTLQLCMAIKELVLGFHNLNLFFML